jgi:DNA polymerase III subunit beta
MQVQMETKVLGERLKQVMAFVDSKAANSAYTHILFTVSGGIGTFRINNTNIGLFQATVRAEGEEGAMLLPAKRLSDILPNLEEASNKAVIFQTDGVTDEEGSSNVTVKCGKYRAVLRARPAKEFEAKIERPDAAIATLPRPAFQDLIEKILFAVPANAGKYTVPVGLLDFKADKVLLVATDGWRLPVAALPGTVRNAENAVPAALNIPKTALDLFHVLTGATFTLSETENHISFETETEIFAASKVSGQFPPYERIIPSATPTTTIVVNRAALAYAIGRARPVADDEAPNVTFSITPTGGDVSPLIIRSTSKAAGMANDAIDVKATGVAVEFVMNADQLLPFVEKAGDIIEIFIVSNKTIITFRSGENYHIYIMPA